MVSEKLGKSQSVRDSSTGCGNDRDSDAHVLSRITRIRDAMDALETPSALRDLGVVVEGC